MSMDTDGMAESGGGSESGETAGSAQELLGQNCDEEASGPKEYVTNPSPGLAGSVPTGESQSHEELSSDGETDETDKKRVVWDNQISFLSTPSMISVSSTTWSRKFNQIRGLRFGPTQTLFQPYKFVNMVGGDMVFSHVEEINGATLLGRINQYVDNGKKISDAFKDLRAASDLMFHHELSGNAWEKAIQRARTQQHKEEQRCKKLKMRRKCKFCTRNFLNCSLRSESPAEMPCTACVHFHVDCEDAPPDVRRLRSTGKKRKASTATAGPRKSCKTS